MLRSLSAMAAGVMIVALPVVAMAEKPAHAGQNGKAAAKVERKLQHKPNPGQTRAARDAARQDSRGGQTPVVIDGRNPGGVRSLSLVQNCPPGLAKKDPACVPPGQAKKALGAGSVIDWNDVHVVTRPGLYGLSEPPAGQRFAIVDGRLVRVDSQTSKILSIIRLVDAIVD